jgi:uncharacterized protein YjbJ (UPF0337 family)
MNREHVKAAAKKIRGTVKQVVAELTGDYNLEAEGKIDKAGGRLARSRGSREGRREKGLANSVARCPAGEAPTVLAPLLIMTVE